MAINLNLKVKYKRINEANLGRKTQGELGMAGNIPSSMMLVNL